MPWPSYQMLPLTHREGFHLRRVGELVFILHLLWGLFACTGLVHSLPHLYCCSLLSRCSLQLGGVGEREEWRRHAHRLSFWSGKEGGEEQLERTGLGGNRHLI